MAKGKTQKNNSDGKNDEEAAGVPSAAIDGNTGKGNDPVKKNGDELSSEENDVANGDSNCGKEKDLSQTENPQQRVTRSQSRIAAPQQKESLDEADKDGGPDGEEEQTWQRSTESDLANGESDREKEKDPKSAVIPVIIAFFIIIVAILLHDQGFSSRPYPPPPPFDFPKIFALQHGGQNYFLLISCSTFHSYAQMCCKRYHIIFSTFSLKFKCNMCVQREVIHNFKNHILVT